MLTRRLVIDTTRRLWQLYAVAAVVLFVLGWISNLSMRSSEILHTFDHLFAWSMSAAWFLAASPAMLLEAREIARLPISRRDVWIARWWLAVVVPAAAIAVGLTAGALKGHVSAGPERFELAIVYCVLYGGCYMSLSAAVLPFTIVPGAWATIQILIRMIVIPLGGALLPLWFGQYLPRTFHDLNGPAMGTFVAAAGLTIAGYFYQPPIVATPGRAHARSPTPPSTNRTSALDGLSGLTLLVVKEVRKALIVYTALLALGIAFWMVAESGSLADFFREGSALIFSALPERSSAGFPAIAMFLMAGISDVGLMGDMRSLRVLPVSAMRLSVILTTLTVLTTAVLWLVLLGAHVLALHTLPSSIRPDLFILVLGGLAVSHSMRAAWPATGAVKIAAGVATLVPLLVAFRLGYSPEAPWVRAAMIIGGSAALVISWWVNVRTLRRGSRIYKMKPPVLPAISS